MQVTLLIQDVPLYFLFTESFKLWIYVEFFIYLFLHQLIGYCFFVSWGKIQGLVFIFKPPNFEIQLAFLGWTHWVMMYYCPFYTIFFTVWSFLYLKSKKQNLTDIENRLVVARGRGWREWQSILLLAFHDLCCSDSLCWGLWSSLHRIWFAAKRLSPAWPGGKYSGAFYFHPFRSNKWIPKSSRLLSTCRALCWTHLTANPNSGICGPRRWVDLVKPLS